MLRRCSIFAWGLCLLAIFCGCGKEKYKHTSAELYYQEAKESLIKGKCYQAQQLFQNLLSDFPGSHLVDEAQYGLGQAYLCDKDYVTARFEFERLLNEYPASPFVDEARYQIGMCYYQESRDIHHDQDETLKAIREFSRFVEDYPTVELAKEAEAKIRELRSKLAAKAFMVAENYMQWKKYQSAQLYCEEILRSFRDTDSIYPARFMLARAKFKMGKLDEALEDLMALGTDGAPDAMKEKILEEAQKVQEAIGRRGPQDAAPDTTQGTLLNAVGGR